jgi:PPOX class probable F420-dependent enzyme
MHILQNWPVACLATCAVDGHPELVPIVVAWVAGELWSPVDGKPKRGGELARVRHVRGDPRVGLLIDEYREDWDCLWWIALDGTARVVGVRPSDAQLEAVAQALRDKYPQYARVPLFAEPPRLLAIRVERVRTWCASRAALPSGPRAAGAS